MSKEVLVVVSKLKNHVKTAHGLSTSSQVPAVLSEFIAQMVTKAAEHAKKKGRKTIMDRDFDFIKEMCCDSEGSCQS